jgi:hypothetical protein
MRSSVNVDGDGATEQRLLTVAASLYPRAFKGRQDDTRDVFLSGGDLEGGCPGALLDLVRDVAGGIRGFGEGKGGELHDPAHLAFGLMGNVGQGHCFESERWTANDSPGRSCS